MRAWPRRGCWIKVMATQGWWIKGLVTQGFWIKGMGRVTAEQLLVATGFGKTGKISNAIFLGKVSPKGRRRRSNRAFKEKHDQNPKFWTFGEDFPEGQACRC